MKNSNKKSRRQKHQNSNKKKSIRSVTQKKLILKGGGPRMDKLLTPEFENDYKEFNSYLESGGAFVEDGEITPEFEKIRNKYFTKILLSELTIKSSSTNQYLKDNNPFFKKILKFENIVNKCDLTSMRVLVLINPTKYPYLKIVKLLINYIDD